MFDSIESHWYTDIIRVLFAMIDNIVYGFLSFIYQIFFSVATADFISGQTIKTFYSRIQLILGVVILFKVAISLFNGILNPDSLSGEKTGFSSIIKRIIIVLIMLMLLVPLNIPVADSEDLSGNSQISWNARMNENGILFGTLYELQSRLLSQNTVSKLILGESGIGQEDTNNANDGEYLLMGDYGDNEYIDSANDLAVIILRCFITINPNEDGIDPTDDDENRVCSEDDDKVKEAYDLYNSDDATAHQILNLVNTSCDDGNINFLWIGDKNFYAFSYSFIISTIVGVLFLIIIVSFTVDASIRVFKLAILRLIAPIPILSYIDPKTQGTFQNWVKAVGTTFIDLFIRLAIINFAIFFIRELNHSNWDSLLKINGANWGVKLFAKIFIYLGLIMFAKEAPKFILDTLGVKNTKGLFSGLAGLAGLTSSAANHWKASREAMKTKYGEGSPEANSFRNRAKSLAAAIGGGALGASNAYSDYTNASDHKWRTAMDKKNSEQAWRIANATEGGTIGGRVKAQLQQDWGGDAEYYSKKRLIEQLKNGEGGAEALSREKEALNRTKNIQESLMNLGKNTLKNFSDEVVKKNGSFDIDASHSPYMTKTEIGRDANNHAIYKRVDRVTGGLKDLEAAVINGDNTGRYMYNGDEYEASVIKKMYADAIDSAVDGLITGNSNITLSQTLDAQLRNVVSSYQEAGYTSVSANSLRTDLKSVNDSIGAAMIDLNNKIDEVDTKIYKNAVEIKNAEKDLKKLSSDVRGNDGRPGGR